MLLQDTAVAPLEMYLALTAIEVGIRRSLTELGWPPRSSSQCLQTLLIADPDFPLGPMVKPKGAIDLEFLPLKPVPLENVPFLQCSSAKRVL